MADPAALNYEAAYPDGPRPESFVDELQDVLKHVEGKAVVRVAEVVEVLKHRGPAMVMLLLCVPFVIPIPSFGLSTPLGAAIMLYGFRVMLRMKPWVPGFIRNRTLKYETLEKMIRIACRHGRRVEKLLKPRLQFMLWPAVDVPIGFSILFCGFFLGLPLPIPFTNAVPAVALILLFLGVIERDGVFVLLGELLSLVILAGTVYVAFLMYKYGLKEGWRHVTG